MIVRSPGVFKHSSTFTGSETAANLNSANAKTVTVKAKWKSNCTGDCSEIDVAVNGYVDYSYTGSVKGVTLKKAGYYKLEVWGAQGGHHPKENSSVITNTAGLGDIVSYGGYSVGVISKNSGDSIYVVVGGRGTLPSNTSSTSIAQGGYNGGGHTGTIANNYSAGSHGSGGGATHIATRTGVLSSLSSYQSSVLIVAGGGGGSGLCPEHKQYSNGGAAGGGYVGGQGYPYDNPSSSSQTNRLGNPGTQTSGGAVANGYGEYSVAGSFGQGGYVQDNNWCSAGAGGGGWYGGSSGGNSGPGGGGSGYIGNSSLLSAKSITKQMYMYSGGYYGCTNSTNAATKTTCTASTGAHVANAANTGNGYARITYLGT